jgi:class 3 adenylate cyclase/tetratricopeptide (TPR) repeat protein
MQCGDQSQKKSVSASAVDRIVKALRSPAAMDLADLMTMWRLRDPQQWSSSPEVYRLVGEKVLDQGEPLLAYDVVNEGLKKRPKDVRLRQLQGLALARSGASERANCILEQLRAEKHIDEETLGMLARTYKDLAARSQSPCDAQKFLRRAAEIYADAYQIKGGYWTGINAATTALLIGKTERAINLAKQVSVACLRRLQRAHSDHYWLLATLGEAALVLRDWSEAANWYQQAGQIGRRSFGDLQSSRRNARLLLRHWKVDSSEIEQYLHIPRVLVFTGHMIDQPGRAKPRFPKELEPAVTNAIRSHLETADAGLGYSSAACGSDILFLEAMLDRGGEICIVLPYEREEFIRDSVNVISDAKWQVRFGEALKHATRVVIASTQRLEIDGVSHDYANQLLLGLARIRAGQLETELSTLAVWDGLHGDGQGGTASVVERWRNCGLPVEIIDLNALRKEARKGLQSDTGATTDSSKIQSKRKKRTPLGFGSQIMSILFADAVGFSKLSEQQVRGFVQHFLGAIGRMVSKLPREIVAKNTWGDALYLVFSDLGAAGNFALDLCDLVTTTDWTRHDLPSGLSLRVALHAGPVYEFIDPVTGDRTYGGTHVSRAARIEPITPPGQVYASEAFAAIAAAQRLPFFNFDYAGQTPMAKNYGTFPMYHMRRA